MWCVRVRVGGEPIGGVGVAKEVVVGGDGGVLVGGVGSGGRVVQRKPGGDGVFRVTALVKDRIPDEGKSGCENYARVEPAIAEWLLQSGCEPQDKNRNKDSEKTPWKLEEAKLRCVMPESDGERSLKKGDDGSESNQSIKHLSECRVAIADDGGEQCCDSDDKQPDSKQ